MTDVVERLAKEWNEEADGGLDGRHQDARWWMNAIAEELEKAYEGVGYMTDPEESTCAWTIDWLRTKAQEGNDDR